LTDREEEMRKQDPKLGWNVIILFIPISIIIDTYTHTRINKYRERAINSGENKAEDG
jgi:hypothetical protein